MPEFQVYIDDGIIYSEPKPIPRKPKFKLDRIVFDRAVAMVYFPSTVKKADNLKFDTDLIEKHDLEYTVKTSKSKGKGKEKVIYQEIGSPKPYIKWELRLRQTRSMQVYFNFNRYFMQRLELKHDYRFPVIHDDNFLPVTSKISTKDFLEVFNTLLPQEIISIYETWYQKLWPNHFEELKKYDEQAIFKYTTLEVAREMYPLNVADVKDDLNNAGTKYSSYNAATNVIYFGDAPEIKEELKVDDTILKASANPWDLPSNEFTRNSHNQIQCNTIAWNAKEPYEPKKQSKMYQKSINLARFEITLYNKQIDFNSLYPIEDIQFTLDEYMEDCGIVLRETSEYYHEMITYVANLFKLDESTIYMLLTCGTAWKSTSSNKYLTLRLLKRKLLCKIKKGHYTINPAFLKMFRDYAGQDQKKEYITKFL